MASDSEQYVHGRCAGKTGWAMLLLVAILALSQAVQAWSAWQGRGGNQSLSPGMTGSLFGVTLVTGGIYYGRLVEAAPGYIKLADVYYIEGSVTDKSGRVDNHLVNRQKNDWHGPEWMAIPVDKILLMEQVGAQSRLAKLIEQDSMQTTVK